ncbi:MAG: hypothetical protein ABI401_00430 [Candidatus Dormibacter sp.]
MVLAVPIPGHHAGSQTSFAPGARGKSNRHASIHAEPYADGNPDTNVNPDPHNNR